MLTGLSHGQVGRYSSADTITKNSAMMKRLSAQREIVKLCGLIVPPKRAPLLFIPKKSSLTLSVQYEKMNDQTIE